MERAIEQQNISPDEAKRTQAFDRACMMRGTAAKILDHMPASEHPLIVRLRAALTELVDVYDEVIRAIDSTAAERTGRALPPRRFQ